MCILIKNFWASKRIKLPKNKFNQKGEQHAEDQNYKTLTK